MTSLVQRGEKSLAKIHLVVTGRQTTIARPDGAVKGMNRGVNAAAAEIEADGGSHHLCESLLPVDGEIASQDFYLGLTGRLCDRLRQRRQLILQLPKEADQLLATRSRF